MTSMTPVAAHRRVVIGVDTHKYVHVAVALDDLGAVLARRSFAADSGGYEQLLDWAVSLGGKLTFAIEGTGSYGAGLTTAVRRRGHRRRRGRRGPTDATAGCAASPTPSTPRTPPGPCWPAMPPPSRRPPTAPWR